MRSLLRRGRPHTCLNSSLLTTLDGGAARGYVNVPQVERAVVVHLCLVSSALAAKAYSAVDQVASALHAMAILQVMSTMVVQERHLWLNLAQMSDADKVCFFDAPVSQATPLRILPGSSRRYRNRRRHSSTCCVSPPSRQVPGLCLPIAEGTPCSLYTALVALCQAYFQRENSDP
ncbi:Nuclear cap-binding protein subunit 3 [Labeo rohita]|uniref:Nuclear cap-binding protein subunit 3 n=1 Tax=Labeo rohita TaxID=84645 RepID=A0ABQ8MZQ0_LABRO|nr:Nuclear cap-binding protein subunit 3 [Labeo rohita]